LHWQAMVRIPGKITRTAHRPLRVVTNTALALVREPKDCAEITMAPDRFKQFQESLFALSPYRVVDVRSIQDSGGVIRGKVPTPDYRQVRELRTNFAATAYRADGLRPRHYRRGQEFDGIFSDQRK